VVERIRLPFAAFYYLDASSEVGYSQGAFCFILVLCGLITVLIIRPRTRFVNGEFEKISKKKKRGP
jgi:hypothetical protein